MATADEIKRLRDETGVSVMQCKKALEEAGGDIEKAKGILQKTSAITASKKADRSLGAGVVQTYVHAGNTVAAVVVLGCETDFVARNEEFVKLAREVAMHVAAMQPESPEALLEQPFIKDSSVSIKQLLESGTQKFGENIAVTSFGRYTVK